MSYTSVTLSGQVQASPGAGVPNAIVTATLSSQISDGSSIIEPRAVSAQCDSDGNLPAYGSPGALVLPANDDETTVPQGSFYAIVVQGNGGVYDAFKVVVPHASAPSVDLFSLARLGSAPTPSTPYVVSVMGLNGEVAFESTDGSVAIAVSGNAVNLEANTASLLATATALAVALG